VLGAANDAVEYAVKTIEIELNSANDNPLIFPDDHVVLSGGNFHGQPIAIVLDLIAIALTTVGNFAERRITKLLDAAASHGLPAFLVPDGRDARLSSGLMTSQYSAAALTSENKILAHPASVDSIPTSGGFEDFVSMGPAAALKLSRILENVCFIVSVELICATEGAGRKGVEKLSPANKSTHAFVRRYVAELKADRVLAGDISALAGALSHEDPSKV
jgi:histidine ammonia-lyase